MAKRVPNAVSRLSKPGDLEVEYLAIDSLVPYARNARTHSKEQVRQIAESMREFRWTNPVLVDRGGGIIAGHGRVLAGKLLGLTTIPAIRLTHLTEAQRRAYILADNKLAENAGWDKTLLRVELKELKALKVNFDATGFSTDEIDRLLKGGESGTDPEDAPPKPRAPVSRPGDLWHLGEHRVLCGDATKPADLKRLMGKDLADCLNVDPPYNVNYGDKAEALQRADGGARNTSRIMNDNMTDKAFTAFLRDAFVAIAAVCKPGAPAYVFHSETERETFTREYVAAGFYLSSNLIWRKSSLVLGRSDYHFAHEPILYGWKAGAEHPWYGERDKTTMQELTDPPATQVKPGEWQIRVGERTLVVTGKDVQVKDVAGTVLFEDKPARNDVHPTMKPVALLLRLIRNSTRIGDIVLDAFGGSGSTLIACHQAQRRARLCELDPAYTDVIVQRWSELAGGEQATLEGRQSFEAVARTRKRRAA